jgi:hypothetical protein
MDGQSTSCAPNELLAYRDGIYASDLLICAVAHFDFFTVLDRSPRSLDDVCTTLQIARRPAEVMVSLFLARHLIKKDSSRYALTEAAQDYLVKGTSHSLVPYTRRSEVVRSVSSSSRCSEPTGPRDGRARRTLPHGLTR